MRNFLPRRGVALRYLILTALVNATAIAIGEAQLPDLTVSDVQLPATAKPGDAVVIYWTEHNVGSGPTTAPLLIDFIYLSEDSTFNSSTATQVGTGLHGTPLAAGASELDSSAVFIPYGLSGSYYAFVVADGGGLQPESDETNNTGRGGPITIGGSLTDLQALSVTGPSSVARQIPFNISYSVRNNGPDTLSSGFWYDQAFLSLDTLFDDADISLGTTTSSRTLAPGQSYADQVSCTIPLGTSGTYYILLLTDPAKSIVEGNYANNSCWYGPVTISKAAPDLAITDLQVPAVVNLREDFLLSYKLSNIGDTTTAGLSWTDYYYLSTDSVFDGTDRFLSSKSFSLSLAPGDSATQSAILSMPPDLPVGNYHVIVRSDALIQTGDPNMANNTGVSHSFTYAPNAPDLVVTGIQFPPTAYAGQKIDISWIVKNQGNRPTLAAQWQDAVFLSQTQTLDTRAAILVGLIQNASYLNAGDSYQGKASTTLPIDISGPYYVFAVTDYYNSVIEISDSNNTAGPAGPFQVATPPLPDLQVTSLIVPGTLFSGQQASISWSVQNFGTASTGLFQWSDVVYLSADSNLNTTTARFLGSAMHSAPLLPDSLSSVTLTVTIPNAIYGTFYAFIVADNYDQVYEGILHANNTRRSTPIQVVLSPPPDLVVTAVSVPGTAASGQLLHASYTVTNQGAGAPFEAAWTDRIYLSSSATFNHDSATLLQKVSVVRQLRPDSSYTIVRDLTLPEGISGNEYLYVYTDADSSVFEFNAESNNIARSSPIALSLSPWPDLQVTDLQVDQAAVAGSTMPFSFTVTNQGAGTTDDSIWVDRVYLSSLPTWDTTAKVLLSPQRIHPLPPGESYTVNGNVTIPSNFSGNAYLTVFADASQSVYEHTDEGNNIRSSAQISISPYPPIDIQIASINGPGTGASGKGIQVDYTVTNAGLGKTLKNSWVDCLYLSPDTLFTPSSLALLGSAQRSEGLAPLESYSRAMQVELPQGISGTYHLLVVADTSNSVDSSPSNNRRAIPITVTATPPPDLVVTAVTPLDPPIAGQPVRLAYTVHNNGPGRAEASGWSDAVYLSSDSLPGPADVLLASKQRVPPLEAGGSYTDTSKFEIPSYASGAEYFLVLTDYKNSLYEGGGEGNNYRPLAATVLLQPPADLVVESIQIPPTAASGADVDVSWTIRNLGPNPVTGVMRDAVYFSADSIWTVEDPLLGVFERTITLPVSSAQKFSGKINPSLAVLADSLGELIQPVPGIDPGSYHVIVRTDIRNNIVETNEANNLLASSTTISVGIPDLVIGTPTSTPLPAGRSVYYRVHTPSGVSLRLSLTSDAFRGANELFARFAQAPTPDAYDYLYDSPQDLNQTLTIPETQEGDYYVRVNAVQVLGVNQTVTIEADTLSFQLTRVTPTQGGNAGEVTVKLQGARFREDFQAYLRPLGASDTLHRIWANKLLYSDPTTAFATFDLTHASPGTYDVVFRLPEFLLDVDTVTTTGFLLDNSQESVLSGAFRVVAGGGPRLEIHLLTPLKARKTMEFPLTLEVANIGQDDAPAPVIYVTSPSKTPIGLTTPASPNESPDLQVLVLGPEGRRDVIPPGGVTSVNLYAWAKDFPSSVFLVQDLTTTGLPLDWDAMEAYYQDNSSPADWEETWNSFKTQVGPTWESFHAALRQAAVDRAPLATDRAYAADELLGDLFSRAKEAIAERSLAQNPPQSAPGSQGSLAHGNQVASTTDDCSCSTSDAELDKYQLRLIAAGKVFPGYPGNSLLHWLENDGSEVDYKSGDGITDDILANSDVEEYLDDIINTIKLFIRDSKDAGNMACGAVKVTSLDDMFAKHGLLDKLSRSFNFSSGRLGITLGHVPGEGLEKPRVTGAVVMLKICKPDCKETKGTLYVTVNMHLHMEDIYNYCPGGGTGQNGIRDEVIHEARQLEACHRTKGFKIVIDADQSREFSLTCEEAGCTEPDKGRTQPPCSLCGDPDPCNESPIIGKSSLSRTGVASGSYTNIPPICPICDAKRYEVPTVSAMDPNEIVGPAGFGDRKWVAVSQTLPYRIRFENDPNQATAPAQIVSVTQKLDTTADPRSFRLSSLGFGRYSYDIAGNRSTYAERLDVRDSLHLYVDVTAGVDVTTNNVFATFTSVDPATGQAPASPLLGFLPVDDSLGHGQGFLQYTIRPRADAHTGDTLHAKASIVFDNNAALETAPYFNTIDAGLPVSRVHLLPASIDSTTFRVAWSGKDDTLASGMKSFTIYVSDNDSTYAPWLTDVTDTASVYSGEMGKTYRFFSIAADEAGNVEALKTSAEAVTLLTGVGSVQALPTSYALLQNYPNPFNPSTTIRFDLPERSRVRIAVYDILGQEVMTLLDEVKDAGAYRVMFDPKRLATGVYIYRMTAGRFVESRKMLLLK